MDYSSILTSGVYGALGPVAIGYVLAAIGLNIHFGYTGLLNFGQVAFMLVGAYGVAISVSTFGLSMWVGVLVGILAAAVLALILGIPALRLRSDYLAISTIAAGEVLRLFYRSSVAEPLTGGVYGLQRFGDELLDLNPVPPGIYEVGPLAFTARDVWLMSVGWGLVALVVIVVYLLIHSPWGRVIRAIREDEEAARSLGKNVYAYKLQSLVLGGVIGALGGMVFTIHQQSAHPDGFDPVVTFFLYTMLVLGGAGRVLGPVLGGLLFWFLMLSFDAFLRELMATGYIPPEILVPSDVGALRLALVGLGLLLLMAFRPQGILGNRREMVLDVR
ncbi:branched-chain amino acid ABC transporter permease [Haloechinothrix sp. YIM 98757]|uniref:Branched-chain amino acid ABC transporter permease n=1 Tax=Haloechinothrix aidingensis TaxID=2752311 RepID=A0A838AG92_9PSEU|nr:branched-chain amino acid ABC transporter permease [Haloechinothrix aidingensis]MBA0128190.1 branched-chain amino acid ABC transporter permease [Haloechinothrix aidingensis]